MAEKRPLRPVASPVRGALGVFGADRKAACAKAAKAAKAVKAKASAVAKVAKAVAKVAKAKSLKGGTRGATRSVRSVSVKVVIRRSVKTQGDAVRKALELYETLHLVQPVRFFAYPTVR